jgi:hypothetical protein
VVWSKHPKNTFAAYFPYVMCLGDDDPAVLRLVNHFKTCIQEIMQGTFKQLPSTREITKELVKNKKKTYYFTARDCATLWSPMGDVQTKWLGARNITVKLKELRNKVNHYFHPL